MLVDASVNKTLHISLNRHFTHRESSLVQLLVVSLVECLTQGVSLRLVLVPGVQSPADVHLPGVRGGPGTGAGH